MIQKLKQIITVFALCSLIILSSCTQEKEFVNEHNHPKIDFKEKSFKEALSIPIFNDAYEKVAKKNGAFKSEDAARTALEDQYGFTIVTDAPVRIITDENGTIFYTILIEREVKEELKFENLMIKVEGEETAAVILKYNMAEKGAISPTGDYTFNDITSTSTTDLNIEGKAFFNSDGDSCWTINVIRCSIPDHRPAGHIATQSCWNAFTGNTSGGSIYNSTETACMSNDVGSGGGTIGGDPGGPSSNNTGGVGASGGTPDPVVVSPIPCRTNNCMELDNLTDPCSKLKILSSNPSFDTKINFLKTKTTGNQEFAFEIHRKVVLGEENVFKDTLIDAVGTNFNAVARVSGIIRGNGHNHPVNGQSIPSWGDLKWLSDCEQHLHLPRNLNQTIEFVVVNNSQNPALSPIVYALTIDDFSKLNTKLTADLAMQGIVNLPNEDRKAEALNLYYSKYNMYIQNNTEQLEQKFLELFHNYGISLFKRTESTNKWNKLVLTNSPNIFDPFNPVIPIPCPN